MEFPHGVCECNAGFGGGCCHGTGPAAFRVQRKTGPMLVCTRCDLSSDVDKELLITDEDPFEVYLNFDPLGAFCLALHTNERKGATQ